MSTKSSNVEAQQESEPEEDAESSLNEEEEEQARERTAPAAAVIYEAIFKEAKDELNRPTQALFWSGLAAGLSLGFSFLGLGLLKGMLPDASWAPLITSFGYTIGFLVVILGRQQLFTENTLKPILPLLRKPSLAVLSDVLRLWGTVLLANLIGALILAFVVSRTALFSEMWTPEIFAALLASGEHFLELSFVSTFVGGIFAGWLLALMVWMLPYAEKEKVLIIVVITYLIGLGGFAHCVVGSIETMYAVIVGPASWGSYIAFFVPALLGNIVGGVLLVAVLNHAQVASGRHTLPSE